MSDVLIRQGRAADAQGLASVEARAAVYPWSEIAYASSLENHQCRVLEYQGVVAGCLIYSRVLDEVELLNVVVDPAFQGCGLGAELVDLIIDENRGLAAKIFLEVRESNSPAIRLYVKKGFELISRRKNYYPAKSGREDALIMVYRYDG